MADGHIGGRRYRGHHAGRIGHHEAPPGAGGPCRQRVRQHLLRPRQRASGLIGLLQAFGGDIGNGVERERHVAERLAAVVEHLHDGADANGAEKRDDEHRNGAAQ